MIFTGYSLYVYLMNRTAANSRDYIEKTSTNFLIQEKLDNFSNNLSFKVLEKVDGQYVPKYFVKQSRNFDNKNIYSFCVENEIYDLFSAAPFMLKKYDYDSLKNCLIFEYLEGVKNLRLNDFFEYNT